MTHSYNYQMFCGAIHGWAFANNDGVRARLKAARPWFDKLEGFERREAEDTLSCINACHKGESLI